MKVSGQVGDVMSESVKIAHSVASNILQKVDNNLLIEKRLHIHFPEGGTPKDGPSAGLAITSSLLSIGLQQALPSNIAMTGEVSLTGIVLPIGGVMEKVLAAKRHHIS